MTPKRVAKRTAALSFFLRTRKANSHPASRRNGLHPVRRPRADAWASCPTVACRLRVGLLTQKIGGADSLHLLEARIARLQIGKRGPRQGSHSRRKGEIRVPMQRL